MSLRPYRTALVAALLSAAAPLPAAPPAATIAAAVADAGRPEADTARDAARKPAEMLAFAGVKPGMVVVDLLPGAGYFTRLFSVAVGPKGKVYGWLPTGASEASQRRFDPIATNPAYANATLMPPGDLAPPLPVDLVWTSQNYHDLYLRNHATEALNAQAFKALKSGGTYIVLDHVARPGSGAADTQALHRIDPELVKAEVIKAGFVFVGESNVLRRTGDDHSVRVYDLHDATDQFILKFRKP